MCSSLLLAARQPGTMPGHFSPNQRFSPVLEVASVLDSGGTASHEVQHKQDQADDQGRVNEGGGYVKCEKSKQPKNNQNCSDYPKHVLLSLLLTARISTISFRRTAHMPLRVGEQYTGTR